MQFDIGAFHRVSVGQAESFDIEHFVRRTFICYFIRYKRPFCVNRRVFFDFKIVTDRIIPHVFVKKPPVERVTFSFGGFGHSYLGAFKHVDYFVVFAVAFELENVAEFFVYGNARADKTQQSANQCNQKSRKHLLPCLKHSQFSLL